MSSSTPEPRLNIPRMDRVGACRRAQAYGRGRLPLRAGARGDFRLPRAAFLRPRLFRAEGRGRAHRRRGLAHRLRAHAHQAGGGVGGHRHRAAHHLSGALDLPARHRGAGAGRPRRADGARRAAQEEARRRGPVRRGAEAAAAAPAGDDRRRHLAARRGHPRHPAPARRPLSPPRAGVAGARAGRRRGRGVAAAIRGFNALPADGPDPAPRPSHRRARRRLDRGSVGVQRGDRGARGGGKPDRARSRRSATRPT